MGWDANWLQAERQLYYNPTVVLLDPDGGMRLVENLSGLSPSQVLGQVLRQLHVAVPSESETISFAEAEANMQAQYNENVAWEKVLEEDESLYLLRCPLYLPISPLHLPGARGGRVAASANTLVVRRHVRWQGADQPAARGGRECGAARGD